MKTKRRVHIDPSHVEWAITAMARHGAYGETGVSRTVYSPEWVSAIEELADWFRSAGFTVRMDAVGNLWGRVDGTEGGKAIVSGSHIDSQRPGGRFDGILGAIAGFTAIRSLVEQFGPPRKPLEALAICEEEGSRFPTAAFWGSRAITGQIASDSLLETRSFDGETIAEAMEAVGLDPTKVQEAERDDIEAFIELHIEQGPVLEQADVPIGIVTAITGIRHYLVHVRGVANHAGAFPMEFRRDAMAGATEMISGVIDTAHRMGRSAVTTVGHVTVDPNGIAIVPGQVSFTVDARHPDPGLREVLYSRHESLMREIAQRRELEVSWEHLIDHPPCICDAELLQILESAATDHEIPYIRMVSGAAHDSQQMSQKTKVAMIFVRSKDGRSHTPDEYSSIDDCTAGIEVLAEAMYRLAY